MTTVTDEMITAWLDGEVSPQQREEIEQAVAASPPLGLRVARLSQMDRMLAPAYAATLKAPIPARFEAILSRPRAPVWSLSGLRSVFGSLLEPRQLGMAAAALVVGVVAGSLLLASPAGKPGFETAADGYLVANKEMAISLASLQSGDTASSQAVRIKLSMVDESGKYCRQFEAAGSAGLACLDGDKWKVDTLSPAKSPTGQGGQYVMADGAVDPAIAAALERRGVKQLLDRTQEAAAIASGWKATGN
ncbi:MAG: hypothetical protein ABMA14_17400 [Hyphomonadaceae bacterium]